MNRPVSDLRQMMQANNAEQTTEVQETNTETNETNTATTEDTSSTTNVNAIEEGKTSEGEQSSSVEGEEQSSTESDLFYEIDGEEVSASTVAEWRKGHMLQSDYTKKSQANAEIKKTLEAKSAEVDGVKSKLGDIITELDSIISKESSPEELAELRDTDPSEFLRRKDEIADKQKLSDKAKKELADLQAKESADRIAQEKEALLNALPEWQDPKQQAADIAMIDDYVKSSEFSENDVNAITSHKLMIMARDAAKYHKLQQEAGDVEKQVQKAPNVVKAKAKQTNKPTQTRAERFYGNKQR